MVLNRRNPQTIAVATVAMRNKARSVAPWEILVHAITTVGVVNVHISRTWANRRNSAGLITLFQ